MTEQTKMTPEQLLDYEKSADWDLDVWIRAFKAFPNDDNLNGVVERMKKYRTCWMHRRAGWIRNEAA